MKFSLIATLVVVLAVGADSMSLAKRDVQAEVDRIGKLISEMSTTITSATQEMVEKVKTLEVTNKAQAQIQPLVEKVQAEAVKLQAQVKPFIANIEGQIKPLAANLNAQVNPLADNLYAQIKPLRDVVENFFTQVMDQTKALIPPQ